MAAANKHRGEVEIELGGKTYVIRPTFQCMCEIEAGTGKGVMALAIAWAARNFGIADAAVIVTAGMKAAGEEGATLQKVGDMIFEVGLANVTAPIAKFLEMALGGPTKGNAKAAGGK